MRNALIVSALSCAALLVPTVSMGQMNVTEGSRVRVTDSSGTVREGIVTDLSPSTLVLFDERSSGEVELATPTITEVAVSAGRTRRFWKYLGLTTAGTSAVLGVSQALTWSECQSTGFLSCLLAPDSRADAALVGVVAGAIVGVPIGMVVGLLVKEERWAPGRLTAREPLLRVQPAAGGRVQFGIRIPVGGRWTGAASR